MTTSKEENGLQRQVGYGLWLIGTLGAVAAFFKSYRENRDLFWISGCLLIAVALAYGCFLLWKSPEHYNWIANKIGFNQMKRLRAILLAVLMFFAPFCVYQAYEEAIKITIEGTIFTITGEPIKNAIITVPEVSKDKPYGVVDSGKFVIRDISVGWSTKQVKLSIRWAGRDFEQVVDVSNGSVKDVSVLLTAPPPPFSSGYTTVTNQSVNLLLEGKITEEISSYLSNAPIVANEVFNDLEELKRRFGQRFPEGEVWLENRKSLDERKKVDNGKDVSSKYLKFLEQGRVLPVNSVTEDEIGLSEEDLKGIGFPSDAWYVGYNSYGNDFNPVFALDYFRYTSKEDLALYRPHDENKNEGTYGGLLNYITSDGVPEGFSVTHLYYTECPGGAEGDFVVRPLSLDIVVIENNKDYPLRIGNIRYRKSPISKLRSKRQDDNAIKNAPLLSEKQFNLEILRPGQKFILPLAITFKFPDTTLTDLREYFERTINRKSQNVLSIIPKLIPWDMDDLGKRTIGIPDTLIRSIYGKKLDTSKLQEEFYYGSSVKLEAVEIEGVPYEVRPKNVYTRTLSGGSSIGSCPYIYSFNSKENIWQNQGTILTRRSSITKYGSDEIEVKDFDGRIRVKEIDRETSYIDRLYLKVVNPLGGERMHWPKNELLTKQDKRYVVLNQGDDILFSFGAQSICSGCKYFVCADGYYEPKRTSSSQVAK